MGRGRRNYEQVTTNPEETNDEVVGSTAVVEEDGENTRRQTNNNYNNRGDPRDSAQVALLESQEEQEPGGILASDSESLSVAEEEGDLITVVILDVAQKKFPVQIPASGTVRALKERGHLVHKVPADRQRLIYQGRMLNDEKSLSEEKITDQVIVHLFPKPRVVIQDTHGKSVSRGNSTAADSRDGDESHNERDEEEGGARVPTIVMNADEAQSRSQILVLGSPDYLESSNNVKLFSFMLLIISSIELINLLALALGVPQDDPNSTYNHYDTGDDIFPNEDDNANNSTGTGADNSEPPEWSTANTFDFIISVMGVYVAILGLKATTMNTLRLARLYLIGTFLTGVGWCLFNYVMTFKLEKESAESHEESRDGLPPMTDSDLAWQALTVMVLPGMVWMLCCLRAWQFQYLLREAEQEAEERIRSELANITGSATSGNHDDEGALPADSGTMA